MNLKFTLRDVIYICTLLAGITGTWASVVSKVNAMQPAVEEISGIKADLKVIKEVSLDSQYRLRRLENNLLRELNDNRRRSP